MVTMSRSIRPLAVAGTLLVSASPALADEGMWLPEQLEAVADVLRADGLALDPVALGDLGQAPLAAVISLGGCSASFVSAAGLVITNHHCAESALSFNSTGERNLLDEGFHARRREDEVWAGPGSRVYVTEAITDVSERVIGAATTATDDRARFEAIDRERKRIVAECESGPGVRCSVVPYFLGESWRLIRQLEIEDVRLVFAPAGAIGFYGGDEDNWMWPRHTGDYTFFRAYVQPDGTPGPHAATNVPYAPAHVLDLAVEGVDPGDFVMVAGYPGSTYRYRTAAEMAFAGEDSYPWQIEMMQRVIAILDARIAEDADAEVRLSSLRFGLANYEKNNRGMIDGFASSGAVDRSRAREAAMRDALTSAGDAAALEQLAALDELVEADQADARRERVLGWMRWNVRLLGAAATGHRLALERAKDDDLAREAGFQERDWPRIRERFDRIERSYDAAADEALLAFWLARADELGPDERIAPLDALLEAYRDTPDPAAAAARNLYAGTELRDEARRAAWLDADLAAWEASEDPLIRLAVALHPVSEAILENGKARQGGFYRLRPAYISALRRMSERPLYPDANSTLRITWGHVRGYAGPDGVFYAPQTTLRGLVEKERGEDPFRSPPELLDAVRRGDHGRWAAANLENVPVNFLSTLDTTGGNSGSVTLDRNGRLVGLLFDGNYEAMASDWLFDPVRTRSIHVDVRYILWTLDRVYDAGELLDELRVER